MNNIHNFYDFIIIRGWAFVNSYCKKKFHFVKKLSKYT